MVDVTRLRIFRAVVAAGSIQAAAVNLGYTPSAVSQQIAALARETGLALVERVGRGIEPTAAGLELATSSTGLFDELAGVDARVQDLREGRAGALSMAYFTSAALAWIPPIVKRVLAEHPRLRLDLRVQDLPSGDDNRVDIEVLVQPTGFIAPAGYRAHHLLDEPYITLVPAGHPLAGRDFVELGELADERWIAHDADESWCLINLHRCCVAAGFTPTYSVRTRDHLTATAFVEAGIGVAVMPRLCARHLPSGVHAIPVVNPTPVRSVYAMVRRSVEATPAVQLVMGGLFAETGQLAVSA